jgi:5-(carboxyamino)imidazole ribonucleotide synthase
VLEQRLALDAEVSAVVARTASGHFAAYPVAENRHLDGILDLTVVPAAISRRLADRVVGIAQTVADGLGYVGVLAVECFVVDGEVFVNELAPRPHNSGHWTLDAAGVSQFEQQIRAICGLGLGDTAPTHAGAAMANLLGDLWETSDPRFAAVFERPNVSLHLYGKSVARPGRKMGHVTAWAASAHAAETAALAARTRVTRPD